MFRGNHPAKVDEKGRLKLPAAFKQLVDAQNVSQFYITSSDGAKAEIWPLPAWEKVEAKLAEFSIMNDAVEKYLSLTSYYGQQVEIDNIEVHNQAAFEASLTANTLSNEDRRSVGAILNGRPAVNP